MALVLGVDSVGLARAARGHIAAAHKHSKVQPVYYIYILINLNALVPGQKSSSMFTGVQPASSYTTAVD